MEYDIFYSIFGKELLERLANELWAIVRNYRVRDLELTYNISLHKLHQVARLDLCVGLGFRPFCEIIGGHQDEFILTNGLR